MPDNSERPLTDPPRRTEHESTASHPVRRAVLHASTFAVTQKGLGVLSGVLAARLLGPSGRGELAAVIGYVNTFGLIAILGLDQAVGRAVSREPGSESRWVSAGLLGALSVALPLAFGFGLVGPRLLPVEKATLGAEVALSAWAIVPILAGYVLLAADQGAFRFARRGALGLVQPALFVSAIVLAASRGHTTTRDFVWAFSGAAIAAGGIRLWIHRATAISRPSFSDARALARSGIRLHLPHVASVLIQKLDLLIVAAICSSEQVGYYAVGIAIGFGQNAIIEAFSRVSFSLVAGAPSDAATRLVAQHARVAQVLSIVVALGLLPLCRPIVLAVFGADFEPAISTAHVLVMAWGVLGAAFATDVALRATGRNLPGIAAFATGCAVLGLGGAVFVPHAGEAGMAWTLLLAATVSLAILLGFVGRLDGVRARDLYGLGPSGIRTTWHLLVQGRA